MARPKKQDTPAPSSNGSSEPSAAPAAGASPASSAKLAPAPIAAADAFATVEPELATLAEEALVPVSVDLGAAVTSVLAAASRVREHRDAIVEQLPKHPVAAVDKLETYAQAAWYAHLVHTYSSSSPESAKALIDEATRLREGLLIAAEALAHRALLDTDAVAQIRKGGGADLAADLAALAALFKDSWGKISGKTAVEKHEIERAAELGPAVLVASASKKHRQTDTDAQRTRAFTLLANAYDATRRALAYIRWKEGDLNTIAPSLFKKRPGRKPGKRDDEGTEAATEAAAEAAPADAAS